MPSNVFEKSKFPDQDKEKVSNKLFEFSFLPVENARWNDECKTFGSRFEYTADIIHITSMVIITEYSILAILKIVNIQYVNEIVFFYKISISNNDEATKKFKLKIEIIITNTPS